MNQKFITVLLLATLAISTLYILFISPNNRVKKPNIDQHSTDKKIKPHVKPLNTAQVPAVASPVNNTFTVNPSNGQPEHEHDAQNNQTTKTETAKTQRNIGFLLDNPAAQFSNLPQEMQNEIKKLNGRNNQNLQPVEIQPGVFIIPKNKGVKVVPIAVMNKDGTVSTYEY